MTHSSNKKPDPKELELENKKIRQLRLMVDLTIASLHSDNLSIVEMVDLIDKTKKFALYLFPDKEQTFDLIYKPRFERIIKEKLKSN
jgi:hypothetical protein